MICTDPGSEVTQRSPGLLCFKASPSTKPAQHDALGTACSVPPIGHSVGRCACWAYWAATGKGKGCPLPPDGSSPHPTACGPTPSRPRGWAPRLLRSLRSLRIGGARVGASAALYPDRRPRRRLGARLP